jgi:hypothetical protein
MNSVVDFFIMCVNPVSQQTMKRIDYFLFLILQMACGFLLSVWLAQYGPVTRHNAGDVLSKSWIFVLAMHWTLLCAMLNRAADTGVTRLGFVLYYVFVMIGGVILFVLTKSVFIAICLLIALLLPKLYLLFWPSRYA